MDQLYKPARRAGLYQLAEPERLRAAQPRLFFPYVRHCLITISKINYNVGPQNVFHLKLFLLVVPVHDVYACTCLYMPVYACT